MEAGLQQTPSADRIHIAFFGRRNAGKSSLVNAITNQTMSIVSEIQGTTTDPVRKAMELLPLGAVVIIDTPGLDDEGTLGTLRMQKTKEILHRTDLAVIVINSTIGKTELETKLEADLQQQQIPFWRSTINATCKCRNSCQIEQLQLVQKLDFTFRNSKKKWLPAIRNKHQKQAVPCWEILSSRTTSFYW